jgi:hypothetical protein
MDDSLSDSESKPVSADQSVGDADIGSHQAVFAKIRTASAKPQSPK